MKSKLKSAVKPGHSPIRVGLLGIGTVGSGTWEVLERARKVYVIFEKNPG